MRIGARAGPFYASTSTRGCGPFLGFIIVFAIPIGLMIEYPWQAGLVLAVLAVVVVAWVRRARKRRPPGHGDTYTAEQVVEAKRVLAELEALYHSSEIPFERYLEVREEAMQIIRHGPQ